MNNRISFIFRQEQADGEYVSVCVGICVFSLVYRTGGAHAGPGDVFTPAFIHQKLWGKSSVPNKGASPWDVQVIAATTETPADCTR